MKLIFRDALRATEIIRLRPLSRVLCLVIADIPEYVIDLGLREYSIGHLYLIVRLRLKH